MMGGWLIWVLLGGLFLFLMTRAAVAAAGTGDTADTATGVMMAVREPDSLIEGE